LARLDADVAILGIPSDEGSPYLPGSRFGPRRIREHSLRFDPTGYYDGSENRTFLEHELRNGTLVDAGDVDILPTNPAKSWSNITRATRQILTSGTLPVVLGGDHAVTAPVVRAWSSPVHVLHFDAHIDYSPFRHGFMYTNMHPMRHVRAMPHVQSLMQIGIRSLRNAQSDVQDSISDGNRVVSIEEYRDVGSTGLLAALPANSPVYVSIDIDVYDLPLVPGCVSGEPNGLLYDELRSMLIAISEHTDVVGFDLVEVNPLLDVGTGATSYLAAHTVLEFLGHICAQSRWATRREERLKRRELSSQ
jgi:agmatinase